MRKINFILIILIIFSYNSFLYTQGATDDTTIQKGEWTWKLIDDFETCYRWPIINKLYIEKRWKALNPTLSIHSGGSKKLEAKEKEKTMGAKIIMDHFGDTRKFIIPLYNLDIDGKCDKITFWVNSRNKELTIKIILKDYWNSIHYLEPTYFTLDFYGWKKLEVVDLEKKIVDQLPTTAPDYRPLQILGFVIENPLHKVHLKPVYIYIDQLEAYTRVDAFTDYDGFDMSEKW